MVNISSDKILSKLGYMGLFLMIITLATPYGDTNAVGLRVLTLVIVCCMFVVRRRFLVSKQYARITLLLIGMVLFSMILNFDTNYTSYMSFIVVIICTIGYTCNIDIDEFQNIFVNIICAISFVSLIIYFYALFNPGFVQSLPNYSGRHLKHFYYLHYFNNTTTDLGYFTLSERNNSMFREPGVFQIYINMALYLLLKDNKRINHVKIILLFITLLSTMSSAGILAGIPMLLLYWKKVNSDEKTNQTVKYFILIVAIVGFINVVVDNYNSLFATKISFDGAASVSMKDRLNCLQSDISLFLRSPLFGVGYSKFSTGVGTECAYSCMAALFGIFFPITAIVGLWRYSKYNVSQNVIALLGFISLAFSHGLQSVLMYPGFFIAVIYGLGKRR